MLKSRITLFVIITIVLSCIVVLIDKFIDKDFNIHDIIVESHGLIFDLIIFGIIIVVYEEIRSKKDKIKRYKEEIDDYRNWNSDEAKYRISGLVKRLQNLGVEQINLTNCYLKDCRIFRYHKDFIKWNLHFTNLENSAFISPNMTSSNFRGANLSRTFFMSANLSNCNFESSFLAYARFSKCTLDGIKLDDAVVSNKNFLNEIISKENTGTDDLLDIYRVEGIQLGQENEYTLFAKEMKEMPIDYYIIRRINPIKYT